MIIGPLVLGALNSLADVVKALRKVELESRKELVYLQDTDPGAVGAKRFWVTTAGVLRVRNEDNTAWIP